MINYQFFPRSHGVTKEIQSVIDCFHKIEATLNIFLCKCLHKSEYVKSCIM